MTNTRALSPHCLLQLFSVLACPLLLFCTITARCLYPNARPGRVPVMPGAAPVSLCGCTTAGDVPAMQGEGPGPLLQSRAPTPEQGQLAEVSLFLACTHEGAIGVATKAAGPEVPSAWPCPGDWAGQSTGCAQPGRRGARPGQGAVGQSPPPLARGWQLTRSTARPLTPHKVFLTHSGEVFSYRRSHPMAPAELRWAARRGSEGERAAAAG